MRFRSSNKAILVVKALVGVLLLQLIGCGNVTSVKQTPVYTPTAASSDHLLPPASLLSPNPRGAFDISEVFHIQGTFSCRMNGFSMSPVLATNRLTYDRGEILQMAAYFDSFPSLDQHRPATLLAVAGGFVGDIPKWNIASPSFACGGDMEVTNIGHSAISIAQIGMKFTADSKLNNYHYRLIDICSLPLKDKAIQCPPGRGAAAAPYVYHYSFRPGRKGTLVQGQATQQPILAPGDTIAVSIYFTEVKGSGSHIYSVVPELTLNTSSEQGKILDLPQLSSIVAFLDPYRQLSCYQLRGDAFVPLDEGPILAPGTLNPNPPNNLNVNCL